MRKTYIDYMKAIGALLVLIAHSISYYSVTYKLVSRPIGVCGNLCYAVNGAVFFVIAGLLCHRQPVGGFYLKKIKRILIPCLFFSCLKLIYTVFISDQYAHSETLQGVLTDAFIYGRLYWFPYTIFVIFLTAPLFWSDKKDKGRKSLILPTVLFAIFLILDIVLSALHLENAFLYFQLNNVCIYMPFFLMGMIISRLDIDRMETALVRGWGVKTVASLLLTGLATFILVYDMGDGDETRVMWELPYYIRFLTALPLIYLIFIASYKLPADIKPLRLAGEFSLQIMLFDSIFRTVIISILGRVADNGEWMIPVVTISSLILSVISSYLIRKIPYVRTLFGL